MSTSWERIAERIVDDVVILDLRAHRVSLSDDPGRLVGMIQQLLDQRWRKILLNLLAVQIIDSEGLGEIIRGYKATRDAGGMLKLCGARQRLRDLLSTTKIDRHVDVFDSEPAALESFAAPV